MKYKPVSSACKCGKPRRKGQRDCRACHAAAGRDARRERSECTAQETIQRTLVHVARKSGGRKLGPEFEAALRGLAERVAGEMEAFNESGNQPGKRAGE